MILVHGLAITIGCLALILVFLFVYIAYKDCNGWRRNRRRYLVPTDHIFEPRSPIPSYDDATKGFPPRYYDLEHSPPPYTI